MASVRHMVPDVNQAVEFYTGQPEFTVDGPWGSGAGDRSGNDLKLRLSGPRTPAARPMPDGRLPAPGGSQVLIEDPPVNPIELFHAVSG